MPDRDLSCSYCDASACDVHRHVCTWLPSVDDHPPPIESLINPRRANATACDISAGKRISCDPKKHIPALKLQNCTAVIQSDIVPFNIRTASPSLPAAWQPCPLPPRECLHMAGMARSPKALRSVHVPSPAYFKRAAARTVREGTGAPPRGYQPRVSSCMGMHLRPRPSCHRRASIYSDPSHPLPCSSYGCRPPARVQDRHRRLCHREPGGGLHQGHQGDAAVRLLQHRCADPQHDGGPLHHSQHPGE